MENNSIQIFCRLKEIETRGVAHWRGLLPIERAKRTAKILAMFWGAMILFAFIPLLHFVLVPLFFVLGIVIAYSTWRLESELVSGQIECPNCRAHMQLQAGSEAWPKAHRCASCYYTLEINKL